MVAKVKTTLPARVRQIDPFTDHNGTYTVYVEETCKLYEVMFIIIARQEAFLFLFGAVVNSIDRLIKRAHHCKDLLLFETVKT